MESYNDPLIQNELDLINVNIVNPDGTGYIIPPVITPPAVVQDPIISKLQRFYGKLTPTPPHQKYFYDPMVLNKYSNSFEILFYTNLLHLLSQTKQIFHL